MAQLDWGWRLNCLSAGSVSLTSTKTAEKNNAAPRLNCLSAGSVSLTSLSPGDADVPANRLNCLSAGSVSLTLRRCCKKFGIGTQSQLPFGWVCFSNSWSAKED